MSRTAALSFRIEPGLKAALERLAKAQDRSVSGFVIKILSDHVAAARKKAARKRARK